jgi:glutaredoxin
MEGLTCPHCQKVSYSASPRAFSPCPHCKFRFAISEDAGHRYVVIDRQLAEFRENYAQSVAEGSDEEFEVIVDRRAQQRPFSGTDRRRVTAPR